jgi:hypothetical protein
MKMLKKLTASALLLAFVSAPISLSAQDARYSYGNGYNEYRTAPNYAAAWVFGGAALLAIIVVAIQNSVSEHSHSHCSGNN